MCVLPMGRMFTVKEIAAIREVFYAGVPCMPEAELTVAGKSAVPMAAHGYSPMDALSWRRD